MEREDSRISQSGTGCGARGSGAPYPRALELSPVSWGSTHALGYVAKTKREGNDKEVILELTDKGWLAFRRHEAYNEATVAALVRLRKQYS